jgi:hypothetical protein
MSEILAHQPLDTAMHMDQDIVDLNLAWLVKSRELARGDTDKASLLFGLDKGLAEILTKASMEDLRQLAASPLLVFRPRFNLAFWRESVTNGKRVSLPLRIQALMMAADEEIEP